MKKQQIKVQVSLSEGYAERFTKECIKVAKKRYEGTVKQAEKPKAAIAG